MFLRNNYLLRHLKLNLDCRLISCACRVLKESNDGGGKQGDAASKLNALLLSIVKEDKNVIETSKIQLPKPRLKQRMKKAEPIKKEGIKNLGSQIVAAAKTVATEIDGDAKEIEARLLHKLLYKESPVKDEILKASGDNGALKDLLMQMKVEKTAVGIKEVKEGESEEEYTRANQVRNILGKRGGRMKYTPKREQRVNLFGEEPLKLFDSVKCSDEGTILPTWTICGQRERKLSVALPPSNHFEQMIDWTEKGMLWKFPIDNEQGMDEEKGVSFASHVLLESHLEGWCPTSGPIRHFMELVCVGLSRNHWLSAAEKEAHIIWYRDFFSEKRQLIQELGAGDIPSQLTK